MQPLRTSAERVTKGVKVIAVAQVLEVLILTIAFFGDRTDVLLLALGCTGLSLGIALPTALLMRRQRIVLEDVNISL